MKNIKLKSLIHETIHETTQSNGMVEIISKMLSDISGTNFKNLSQYANGTKVKDLGNGKFIKNYYFKFSQNDMIEKFPNKNWKVVKRELKSAVENNPNFNGWADMAQTGNYTIIKIVYKNI
jgi:hypothetical protein